MEKYSNALFDLIAGIVGAATREENGYPERLLRRLRDRFGGMLAFVDSLIAKISG